MTGAALFTEHDMLSVYLLGMGIGLLVGAFAVAALLGRAVARDIDRATTLPAPPAVEPDTERIDPLNVVDLRRARSTFEETA